MKSHALCVCCYRGFSVLSVFVSVLALSVICVCFQHGGRVTNFLKLQLKRSLKCVSEKILGEKQATQSQNLDRYLVTIAWFHYLT